MESVDDQFENAPLYCNKIKVKIQSQFWCHSIINFHTWVQLKIYKIRL